MTSDGDYITDADSDCNFYHEICPSDRIMLQGLVPKPELNGVRGWVKGYIPSTERYGITLDSGKSMSVKLENIKT